jgi:hypothetical protein
VPDPGGAEKFKIGEDNTVLARDLEIAYFGRR